MSRVGVLVVGPAGTGKSTFCNALLTHIRNVGRMAHLVNLDPAAEPLNWEPTIDIKDLISLDDVTDEMNLGPNGGLIYCMEFLLENLDWLEEEIGDYNDDYLIFDCPGQIELYTHIPVLPLITKHLKNQLGFSLCATYLLESPFVVDINKYFAGVLSAMSAMILLECPHINIMSKMDLIKDQVRQRDLKRYLEPDPLLLADAANAKTNPKFHALNESIVQLIESFNMVSFLQLDLTVEDSIGDVLSYIDDATQWAEAQEPKEPKEFDVDYEGDV